MMVSFRIESKSGPEFSEEVEDVYSLENVRDMVGVKYDEERGELRTYTENISEIEVDGVRSDGEDYEAFDIFLDKTLGPYDPLVIQLMQKPRAEQTYGEQDVIEDALELTGGDIPSVFPNILMKNLYPVMYQQYYENWRKMTVEKAREELMSISSPEIGAYDFIQDILDLFSF